jgi:hypothetical protein
MANRPTAFSSRWAYDLNTESANNTVSPVSGKRDVGFLPNTRAPAQYFNDLFCSGFRYDRYVSDGVFAGPSTTGLELTVNAGLSRYTRATGSFLNDGYAENQRVHFDGFSNAANDAGGTVTAVSDLILTVTPFDGPLVNEGPVAVDVFAWTQIEGNFEVRGKLNVEDDTDIGGDLHVVGHDCEIDGDLAVGGAITVDASITLDPNQNVIVSGTGDYKHGDRTLTLQTLGAWISTNMVPDDGGWVASTGAGTAIVQVPLKVGDRIKTISYARSGNSSANLTGSLKKYDSVGGSGVLASSGPTAHGATWATTTLNPTDTTLAAGESLALILVIDATGMKVGSIQVVYDRP